MTNTYEVLLQRENGLNKTVHIHDCMYEDEARLEAESTYGLPVLRVLFKGRTQDDTLNYNLPPGNTPVPINSGVSLGGIQSILGLLIVGAGILIVAEFWYLFVGGGIGYICWKGYEKVTD